MIILPFYKQILLHQHHVQ